MLSITVPKVIFEAFDAENSEDWSVGSKIV